MRTNINWILILIWIGVGVTLGSAVTTSMNLTNSTDTMETAVPYKTETTADMHLYYQVKQWVKDSFENET